MRILLKNGCMEAQGECCGANDKLKGGIYRVFVPFACSIVGF